MCHTRPVCRGFIASLRVSRGREITVRIPCLVGFASASDRRVEAILRRGVRSGLNPSPLTAEELLIDSADDKQFDLVLRNGDHVLHELLPERVDISYNLRFRSHDKSNPGEEVTFSRKRTLSRGRYVKAHINRTHILTLPPITRLLFKDSY